MILELILNAFFRTSKKFSLSITQILQSRFRFRRRVAREVNSAIIFDGINSVYAILQP